jgi:hypothetical protein
MSTFSSASRLAWIFAPAMLAALVGAVPGRAQQAPVRVAATTTAPTVPVEQIIERFAAKEAEFRQARDNYTYRQTVRVMELDADGVERGRYELVSDIIFTPEGKRLERVVHAPVSTLVNLLLTPEDEQDLRNVQPFVLTTKDIPKYNISYLGPQHVDELDTYVFAVKPKALEPGQRYFEGQIWVDQRDLQIVKTYGKGVGRLKKHEDNQFPRFETYRDQIDGKYWFPVYTRADDVLHFKDHDQRVRMIVKYEDYKQFKSQTGIQYEGVVNDKDQSQKNQNQNPKKK